MSTEAAEARIARLLLVLDACPGGVGAAARPLGDEAPGLPSAARLAHRLDAALGGLFVEDERLQRVAEWPPSVEIGLHSASERPLDGAALLRRLGDLAARSERQLAAAAASQRLPFSFQRARGSGPLAVIAAALAASAQSDLLWLAGRRSPAAAARFAGWAAPVYLLFSATPAARRGLLAAWRLAQVEAVPLVLLLPLDGAADGHGLDLRPRAEAALAQIGARAQVECVDGGAEHLHIALGGLHGTALILPGDAPPGADVQALGALLDGVRCPLLLAR